jgi:hypothetical protein
MRHFALIPVGKACGYLFDQVWPGSPDLETLVTSFGTSITIRRLGLKE